MWVPKNLWLEKCSFISLFWGCFCMNLPLYIHIYIYIGVGSNENKDKIKKQENNSGSHMMWGPLIKKIIYDSVMSANDVSKIINDLFNVWVPKKLWLRMCSFVFLFWGCSRMILPLSLSLYIYIYIYGKYQIQTNEFLQTMQTNHNHWSCLKKYFISFYFLI